MKTHQSANKEMLVGATTIPRNTKLFLDRRDMVVVPADVDSSEVSQKFVVASQLPLQSSYGNCVDYLRG